MTPRRRALIDALRDPEDRVRAKATEALDRLDLWEGIPELIAGPRSLGRADWLRLLGSLTGRRDELSLKLAVRCLDHPDEDVRLAAIGFAAECADLRAGAAVARRLGDPSPLVRAGAAEALGGLGDRRRGDDVAALLEDLDSRVVASAARALGLLDHVASEPRLLGLLVHADPDVRGSAAEALGRIGRHPQPS